MSRPFRAAMLVVMGLVGPMTGAQVRVPSAAEHVRPHTSDRAGAVAARDPDAVYIPTAPATVDAMLRLARVTNDDTVYDLGCGDGRLVVAAASRFGARGVGVDIDPQRVHEAAANVRTANLEGRVRIVQGDLRSVSLEDATVVTLYLSAELNAALRPKLLAELRPGARIVSHHFDMGDWTPDQTVRVGDDVIFLWRIP